jgi:autotransporter-associated beta strand protein
VKISSGGGTFTVGDNNATGNYGGTITGGLGVTKIGSGTQRLAGSNGYTGQTTLNGGTLVLAGAVAQGPVLTGNGTDIQHGRMVFDYTGEASPGDTIKNLLKTSYASGFTAGQFRNSTVASNHGLGWVDDAGTSKVTVAPALYGDGNLDGKVDLTDFTFLAANFNGVNKGWLQGDFNYDGTVNLTDFTFLASNFNQSLSAESAGLGSPVPEPVTMSVLALLSAGLLGRRSRR